MHKELPNRNLGSAKAVLFAACTLMSAGVGLSLPGGQHDVYKRE